MRALAIALVLCGSVGVAQADTTAARWLRERGSLEWMVGSGGWRTGLGLNARVPGFQAVAGGTEVVLGVDLIPAVGVFLSGHFLAGEELGQAPTPNNRYFEAMGGAGVQVRPSDTICLRIGPSAGRAIAEHDSAILVGGFLSGTIDLFSLGSGRLSLALSARLDLDAMLDSVRDFPGESLALTVGLGLRY